MLHSVSFERYELLSDLYLIDSFWSSFLIVFQVLTGENWNELMYQGLVALDGNIVVVIYFVSLNLAGNYVVLNLFLAILLNRFDEKDDDDETPGASCNGPSSKSL